MSDAQFDFGMIGLGVMGRNFILNVADNGFSAIGLDLDASKAQALEEEGKGKKVRGTTDTADFIRSLKKPRAVMLLVPAGSIVDKVVDSLLPHLEVGDLIIDGGNSFFPDTERRMRRLQEKNLHFLGVGVSGGAKGARFGPSIMPGGKREAYEIVRPILEAVSAKVDGEPCVTYLGEGSSGHYVKMVHNGIEYALMQLIAEAYDMLKHLGGLRNEELQETFARWNKGKLNSFLIEITAAIFGQADDRGEGWLIDKILDKAKQKGTGKWTSQNAMDLGIPIPTIDAAVTMRGLSSLKEERLEAEAHFRFGLASRSIPDHKAIVQLVEDALYFAFIVSYAQGMSLLAEASKEKGFKLDLQGIARIWRGGCIIRAALLESIRRAFVEDEQLPNLLKSPVFQDDLIHTQSSARTLVKLSLENGIPSMAFSSALAYFDAYRRARLPLNLVQAQRDYFGSHTYERTDRDGVFHTKWEGMV